MVLNRELMGLFWKGPEKKQLTKCQLKQKNRMTRKPTKIYNIYSKEETGKNACRIVDQDIFLYVFWYEIICTYSAVCEHNTSFLKALKMPFKMI